MRPVDNFFVLHSGEAEDKAEQFPIGAERTQDQSADVANDLQQRRRHGVVVFGSPHLVLQRNARVVIMV